MKLIVGLGNPGKKYKNTRHNLGFMVVEGLARKMLPLAKTNWKKNKKFNSELLTPNSQLILVKPQTFMNASGFAVVRLTKRYTLDAKNLWVIHDDVDLLLGKIKIRIGGAAAGHHGVESLIQQLGTDEFVRFRLGIGRPEKNSKIDPPAGRAGIRKSKMVEKYVLQDFDINEKSETKAIVKKAVKAIRTALDKGIERAMNEYNQ